MGVGVGVGVDVVGVGGVGDGVVGVKGETQDQQHLVAPGDGPVGGD